MSARDPHRKDPEEDALIEQSKRLIAEMDELIRRAKVLHVEHRHLVERIKEKREEEL